MPEDKNDEQKLKINRLIVILQLADLIIKQYNEQITWAIKLKLADYPVIEISLN